MYIDCVVKQLNKFNEELCGDNVEIVKNPDNTVIVLADGLGSGVKANILSTMTKKIASTMLSQGMDLEDVVETISNTLPTCKLRNIAYSTFTIAQIFENSRVKLVEFDNPSTIFIRDGLLAQIDYESIEIAGKKLKIANFDIKEDDFLFIMSDGLIHSGLGGFISSGWGLDGISKYLKETIKQETKPAILAENLLYIAEKLDKGRIGDDTSVVAVKVRNKEVVNIAVGPPLSKEQDQDMVNMFINAPGKKVVCGGTTSSIISDRTGRELKVFFDYKKSEVPPKGEIDGIDLVTEGVITLSKCLEIIETIPLFINKIPKTTPYKNVFSVYKPSEKDMLDKVISKMPVKSIYKPVNPAEELAVIMKKADEVNFIVGRAMNPAHQNPDFPLERGIKFQLINEIKEKLEKMGKEVNVTYF